eukprot:2091440-Rhodomonas_salina.1
MSNCVGKVWMYTLGRQAPQSRPTSPPSTRPALVPFRGQREDGQKQEEDGTGVLSVENQSQWSRCWTGLALPGLGT